MYNVLRDRILENLPKSTHFPNLAFPWPTPISSMSPVESDLSFEWHGIEWIGLVEAIMSRVQIVNENRVRIVCVVLHQTIYIFALNTRNPFGDILIT